MHFLLNVVICFVLSFFANSDLVNLKCASAVTASLTDWLDSDFDETIENISQQQLHYNETIYSVSAAQHDGDSL